MANRRTFMSALGGLTLATGLAGQTRAAASGGIVSMDAIALSLAIHQGSVSCVEVMAAYLDQIDRFNPVVNAIVSRAPRESLMRQAAQLDGLLKKGCDLGWMHGFPVAIKDLSDAEGFVTTAGSPIFKDRVARADALHVARMKAAGAIVIGKTNVPEFGLGSQTYNPVFGATKTPYDPERTAGGSSGGAAAALASRMVPVADGSDMMGSLRNPGAYNNVIGFRPTPNLVPLGQSLGETLACNGPMARTVEDAAQLLAIMAGPDPRYPTALPIDPRTFKGSLDREWRGARIGWLGDFNGYLAMAPGVLAVCEQALKGFTAAGFEVVGYDLGYPMAELWETWLTYRHWMNRSRGLALYDDPELRKQLKPEHIWELEGGMEITGDQVSTAIQARGRFYQRVSSALEELDFLVLPTAQVFPFFADETWPRAIAGRQMDTYHRWMEVVVPGTLSGCPVINVPAGFNASGLPMGIQIIGRRYQDFKVLQAAYAYQQSTRWNLDLPPPLLRSV